MRQNGGKLGSSSRRGGNISHQQADGFLFGTLRVLIFGIIAIIATVSVWGDDQGRFEAADQAIRSGDYAAAEQIYDQILSRAPDDVEAHVKRGTIRSWQGRRAEAREDFQAALAADPHHLGALVGLGYDLTWGSAYPEAASIFRRAIAIAPSNAGARKGLAYTYLWSGRGALAAQAFSDVRRTLPEDPEAAVGLGQAHLALRHHRRARSAFQEALVIEPERLDAKEGLGAVQDLAAPLELNVWFGNTTSGGKSGLRQVELATWPHSAVRLWARYDNSLGLDNPTLARTGQPSEAVLGGVLAEWSGTVLTRLEAGRRELGDGLTQTLFLPEVTFLRHGFFLKAGAVLAPSSQNFTDRTGYFGVGIPVSRRCRLEPMAYLSEFGATADREWRTQVYGECRSATGWTFGLGGGGGRIDASAEDATGRLWTGLAHVSIPIGGYHRVFVTVRHEDSPLSSYTVSMLGLTLRLPRN